METPEPATHWLFPLVRSRFFWLLLALIAFILFAGEVVGTSAGAVENFISLVFILLAVTFATRSGKGRRLTMVTLSILLTIAWTSRKLFPSPAITCIAFAIFFICLLLSVLWTLQFVLGGNGIVSADHIIGAICAYIMIAMIFAAIFSVQLILDPASFKGLDNSGMGPYAELIYFSFTTLSTVGYGDIVPATARTRSVSMIEQLTGTFYVAIIIARLASLYGPSRSSSNENSRR